MRLFQRDALLYGIGALILVTVVFNAQLERREASLLLGQASSQGGVMIVSPGQLPLKGEATATFNYPQGWESFYGGVHVKNDERIAPLTNGNPAVWTFTIDAQTFPKKYYALWATWSPYEGAATGARYRVAGGIARTADQSKAPTKIINGQKWYQVAFGVTGGNVMDAGPNAKARIAVSLKPTEAVGGAFVIAGPMMLTEVDPKDIPVCGDGIPEGNEFCDDGNTESGDGCSSVCWFEGRIPRLASVRLSDDFDSVKVYRSGASGRANIVYEVYKGTQSGAAYIGNDWIEYGRTSVISGFQKIFADAGGSDVYTVKVAQCPWDQTDIALNADCGPSIDTTIYYFPDNLGREVCGNGYIGRMDCIQIGNQFRCGGPNGALCNTSDQCQIEQCDDGNANNNDGCSNACMKTHPEGAMIIDNTGVIDVMRQNEFFGRPGFSARGNWHPTFTGGYEDDLLWSRGPLLTTNPSIAQWWFSDLPDEPYQVAVTWKPYKLGAKNAQYSVQHAGGTTEFKVDQSKAPLDVLDERTWYILGSFRPANGSLKIRLVDIFEGEGSYVSADAVRISLLNPNAYVQPTICNDACKSSNARAYLDRNNDGTISQAEITAAQDDMMRALRDQSSESRFDLDGDGFVTTLDLALLVKFVDENLQ